MTDRENQTPPDDLEAKVFTYITGPADDPAGSQDEPGQKAEAEANAAMQKIEAGFKAFIIGALKFARKKISEGMPEILDEWPDNLLTEPAETAVPLAKKYAGSAMAVIGKNPELAAFVFSVLPLAMGYMNAQEKHIERVGESIASGLNAAKEPGVLQSTSKEPINDPFHGG